MIYIAKMIYGDETEVFEFDTSESRDDFIKYLRDFSSFPLNLETEEKEDDKASKRIPA